MKAPTTSLAKATTPSTESHKGSKSRGQPTPIAEATSTSASADEEISAHTGTGISAEAAQRILIGLMIPNIIMPMASSMSRVALPIIRDDFQIPADTTAWIATAFTLPFMILMPVYGRLSDGVGRRRLLLAGIVIFAVGTAMTVTATELAGLMIGRMVQGIGTAGIMPLGMALISTIFSADQRGKAMGTWSSVGPVTGVFGPLLAGFLVTGWGWRGAFAPPLIIGVIAFVVVYKVVPAGLSTVRRGFIRGFDWIGVVLMAIGATALLFFLSSRPITGVPSLQDWRLLLATLVAATAFVVWETRRKDPFVALSVFRNRIFTLASISASARMFAMSGISFLIPLYLVDIHNLSASALGFMLMINPGCMALMVRFGGMISDRWGSRWPVVCGLTGQIVVAGLLSRLPATVPLWPIIGLLAMHGLSVGLMLAALHSAAMQQIAPEQMGAAAGLYSMIRFFGAVIGTALAGVLLQIFLDQGLLTIDAYQIVFLCIAGFSAAGLLAAFNLRKPQTAVTG